MCWIEFSILLFFSVTNCVCDVEKDFRVERNEWKRNEIKIENNMFGSLMGDFEDDPIFG